MVPKFLIKEVKKVYYLKFEEEPDYEGLIDAIINESIKYVKLTD